MKVLWVTNTIFPELANKIGEKPPVVGGWMYGLADDLANSKEVSLHIATVTISSTKFNIIVNDKNYHLLHSKKDKSNYDTSLEQEWKKLVAKVNPDIIHIHGTEYAHGLSLMKICPKLNYVVSIQGLIYVYERYYKAGLSNKTILSNITFRDIVKGESILSGKKEFLKRGHDVEKKYLALTQHVIGRTDWDKSHACTINPKSTYHFCNESLRDSFYQSKKWSVTSCEKNTIFLSQATVPLKGLHKILEAVKIVKPSYPNIKVYVAGGNIILTKGFKNRLKLKGYGKIIRKLIRKYNLKDNIEFTGRLNEKQMVEKYLNSHIFICPSSIENSSNSVGEAQILGVPTISAFVGGISNMIEHGKSGLLYRFEEIEMLAQQIKTIFQNDTFAQKLSSNGILVAEKRHNRKSNLTQLINIYNSIQEE